MRIDTIHQAIDRVQEALDAFPPIAEGYPDPLPLLQDVLDIVRRFREGDATLREVRAVSMIVTDTVGRNATNRLRSAVRSTVLAAMADSPALMDLHLTTVRRDLALLWDYLRDVTDQEPRFEPKVEANPDAVYGNTHHRYGLGT